MSNVRIKDLATDAELRTGDYVIVDSETEGTRKFDLGAALSEGSEDREIYYAECSTAAGTVSKTVSAAGITELTTGLVIAIKFTNANSASNPTLNVNTLGAIAIKKYGTTAPGTSAAMSWQAGSVIALVYDGTYWQMMDWNNTDTTYSAMSQSEMQTGTATTARTITAARLKEAIEYHGGGGGSITVDDELSSSSTNPVQNMVINAALENKQGMLNKGTAGSSGDVIDYNDFKTDGVWYIISALGANASNAPVQGAGYAWILSVETSGSGSATRIKQTATRYGVDNQITYIRTTENNGAVWRSWQKIETTNNLVTSLSASSTDTQYPSAKCVYDGLGEKQNATTIVNKTSSETSQTLELNTFYIWPEMSALTITCPATDGPYAFRFTSGATATTLSLTGITMPDSFTVEANKVYEINVFQGYGLAASWAVSE